MTDTPTTNLPTCCADCSHYRGDPTVDCALVNRCPSNAFSSRPVWCPLEETVAFKVRGDDVKLRLSHDARRWLAENSEVVEALASGAWKAVPVKATKKMLDALWDVQCWDGDLHDMWSAILAAAPAKPEDGE